MAMSKERTYGRDRKRESTYLDKETSEHFREFFRQRPWLDTKSKTIAAAVEFYMYWAEKCGLDEKHWPNLKHCEEARRELFGKAAEPQKRGSWH